MFNNRIKKSISVFFAFILFTILQSCTASKPASNSNNGKLNDTANNEKKVYSEYIIVLRSNSSIESALDELKDYDAIMLRDLKRNRYLIRLNDNLSVEELNHISSRSMHIEFIQPNYSYKAY